MYNNIYNITNDFIKESQKNSDFAKLVENWNGKRGPKRKLTLSKVIALNIYRFSFHIKDLKAFHRFVKETNLEPNMPNYENFLKASNKALPILSIFLRFLLKQNQAKNENGIHFIDSTPVSTCLNRRIRSHKVTKTLANRGKSTKGWFYGFKLHGVCSENGDLESILFTSGNINDSKCVEKVTKGLKGKVFADAGYLKKSSELVKLAENGIFLNSATRKNMNRAISKDQLNHLRKRNRIETIWGILKQNFFLEYHQARSLDGIFRHYITCILAFLFIQNHKTLLLPKTRI